LRLGGGEQTARAQQMQGNLATSNQSESPIGILCAYLSAVAGFQQYTYAPTDGVRQESSDHIAKNGVTARF
jgi:hypothetical protein